VLVQAALLLGLDAVRARKDWELGVTVSWAYEIRYRGGLPMEEYARLFT
jgi:hypothetical protein